MRYKHTCALLFGALIFAISVPEKLVAQNTTPAEEHIKTVLSINKLYQNNKWDEGKAKAQQQLEKNPNDSDMRMLIGKYYLHRRDYNKARYELVKSLADAPSNVETKQMLITVETQTKRYSSAICYINELLEANPYGKDLWRRKIELYRGLDNQVEADRLLKRMAQIYPEDEQIQKDLAYAATQQAQSLYKQGKLDASIELSKASIEEQPKHPDSYLSLIDSYIKAGDYGNALTVTERGINTFPANSAFAQKKIAILEHQQRYPEILKYLDEQSKGGNSAWKSQYNYILLDAARQARNNEPTTLYGKILQTSPGNKEAYSIVFNDLIAKQQYEEAMQILLRHRRSAGNRKELELQELMLYKRMDNQGKVNTLTETLAAKYPNDSDLRESMLAIQLQRAKNDMQDGQYSGAIAHWKEILKNSNDKESYRVARQGLYNAYVSDNRLAQAISTLDEMLLDDPNNPDLEVKKADLYAKLGDNEKAVASYQKALKNVPSEDRDRYVSGFGELMTVIVKNQNDNYELDEAKESLKSWLEIDPKNKLALLYLINNHYQRKDYMAMLNIAKEAQSYHPNDINFQMKLAEALGQDPAQRADAWKLLHQNLQQRPYHLPLQNTFVGITETYAQDLIDNKEHSLALEHLDTTLHYDPKNKELLYLKGLAYEGLKQYDSAYVYQQFYEPSPLEINDFKQHLTYLSQRSYQNVFGISHLRARFGEDYTVTSISSAEYTRIGKKGIYAARVNYAGREQGKGIQGQVEWTKPWTEKFSTKFDVGLSNNFFAKTMVNAAAFYQWKPTWEGELGIGHRYFFSGDHLYNLNIGATKELEDFRLSTKLSNFALNSNYLYSVFFRGQYFMNNPKNYLMVLSSVGNSPDVDLIDYQLTNSFNVFNTMVGAGIGRSLTRNVHASIIGSWYNFRRDTEVSENAFRNLYNAYFQVNVSF